MRLDHYANPEFNRGRPAWVEALWICVSGLAFSTWLPGSSWRRALLRLFGARIGRSVEIKPRVRVKFPWKLSVGDYSWLGESVWIDNVDRVTIGAHCCVSQGAYLCTGSHRWDVDTFKLVLKPIIIADGCWVAAKVTLSPGTVLAQGAVLGIGVVASGHYEAETVYLNDSVFKRRPR